MWRKVVLVELPCSLLVTLPWATSGNTITSVSTHSCIEEPVVACPSLLYCCLNSVSLRKCFLVQSMTGGGSTTETHWTTRPLKSFVCSSVVLTPLSFLCLWPRIKWHLFNLDSLFKVYTMLAGWMYKSLIIIIHISCDVLNWWGFNAVFVCMSLLKH